MNQEPEVKTLSETDRFVVWVSEEPETGETVYHVEVTNVTLHFFADEWDEFVQLMMEAIR